MVVVGGRSRGRVVGWWWIALSAVAIAVLAVVPYLSGPLHTLGDDGLAANYAYRPQWVKVAFYVHVVSGGLALLLSPVQFAARLRARVPRVHRVCGRVTFVSLVAAGGAGLVLAPFSLAGMTGTLGFGALGILTLVFAAAAFLAIRRGDVAAHQRWAVRTFALIYAGVMLRLWQMTLVPLQVAVYGIAEDVAFDRSYGLMPFLSWVPNLLVAEWMLRRQRRRSPASGAGPRVRSHNAVP
ncbi:DUF2306 domain-containing protein [Sinosporangium siamense]|uniref:Uncharacterized protein n=1 Tax=Sinosporangium siamense TaxID=1367973 RepID=A0A919V7T4_9ACTN|nr:DUF2306 domain-containing protein [Sinosporangium siamense]GII92447.1 hypothetical protein Ssi02_26780 [Sinosporangium siamense]